MTNDNLAFSFIILCFTGALVSFLLFATRTLTTTTHGETERQTVVYCVEKPVDCKIKYDYYKLENSK